MSGRIKVGSVDLLRFRWRSSVFVVFWRGRFKAGFHSEDMKEAAKATYVSLAALLDGG